MLGDIVDHEWEKSDGASVQSGEIIGSIEGFKAIADILLRREWDLSRR
jgi:glycine cleavage system H protein